MLRLVSRLLVWLPILVVSSKSRLSAQSTDTNSVHYEQVVQKRTPSIQWAAPAGISYGTPLSALQLAATADVAGTFTYSPASGTLLNAGTETLTVAFTPADTLNYNSTSSTVPLQIAKAQAVVILSRLQQTYTGQPVPVTAVTSPAGLNVVTAYNSSTTAPTSPGVYSVLATIEDTNYAGSATGTLTIQGLPTITLSSDPLVLQGSSMSILVKDSSGASVPAGQVTFLEGSVVLGIVPLVGGQATLSTSPLAPGTHSITAIYSGDATHAGGTVTTPITILDYSVQTSQSGITLSAGKTVTSTLSIIPTSGNVLPLPATMMISGLTSSISVNVSPSQWVAGANSTWTLPANTPLTTTTLSFTEASTPMLGKVDGNGKALAVKLAFVLCPFFGTVLLRSKRTLRSACMYVLFGVFALAVISLNGCGGPGPPQPYPVTVTVSSGALQHITELTLIVL
jgi:hypothetical protein